MVADGARILLALVLGERHMLAFSFAAVRTRLRDFCWGAAWRVWLLGSVGGWQLNARLGMISGFTRGATRIRQGHDTPLPVAARLAHGLLEVLPPRVHQGGVVRHRGAGALAYPSVALWVGKVASGCRHGKIKVQQPMNAKATAGKPAVFHHVAKQV